MIYIVNVADIIIVSVIALALGFIIFFRFWKHRKDGCYGCAEKGKCVKYGGEDLVCQYHKTYGDKKDKGDSGCPNCH